MDKKKLIKWVGIGLAMVVIAVLFMRSCSLYDQNSLLKGRYDELKKIAVADHAVLTKEVAALTKDIGLRDKKIAELTESITVTYTDLSNKDSSIAELVQKLHQLEISGDPLAQIANLKEQVKIWSEKFTLAESIISEQDKIIGEWAIKYADAVKIGEDWKKQYEQENTLRLLGEKRIGKLESSLRWTRFWKTGSIILAVAGVGYIGLDLIRSNK